jgi:hypothetical protein
MMFGVPDEVELPLVTLPLGFAPVGFVVEPGAPFPRFPRLLGLVLRPEPDWPLVKLPPGPLPTVGLLCGTAGWLGVTAVLPGPGPPGTPAAPGFTEPVPPVPPEVAPVDVPAVPVPDVPAVPLVAPPLAPPPADPPLDPPPLLWANASVEPAARKAATRTMDVFMAWIRSLTVRWSTAENGTRSDRQALPR